MSSFAIGYCPSSFIYASNEMPGWYQMTNAGPRDFAQMNLGCLVLDGYNTWSYNQQYASIGNYSLSFAGAWQNMIFGLCGLVSSFGTAISGGAATTGYTAGNFGSLVQPTTNNGDDDDDDAALDAANERARRAEAEAANLRAQLDAANQKIAEHDANNSGKG